MDVVLVVVPDTASIVWDVTVKDACVGSGGGLGVALSVTATGDSFFPGPQAMSSANPSNTALPAGKQRRHSKKARGP
jgi:hypothetical protein